VVPLVNRAGEVTDPERTRREVLTAQDGADQSAPRRIVRGLRVGMLEPSPPGGPGRPAFPVYDVRSPDAAPGHTVLYLHGGGFVSGIDRNHWRYVARLARASGARVVVPAYPLAPRATWRDALPPLAGLFEQLAVESPAGVTLAGDSAGGGLALAVAQQVAAGAGPQPTGLVLFAPWVDLAGSTPGTEEMRARDTWLRLSKLRLYGAWWAGDGDPERPEVSPLHGGYEGLPRMLVLCGTRDLLLPQVRMMVDRAESAGVPVSYREESDLIHVYPILPVPEAKPAFAAVLAFLQQR
jgi:epsilon-lactone hydrolase